MKTKAVSTEPRTGRRVQYVAKYDSDQLGIRAGHVFEDISDIPPSFAVEPVVVDSAG